MAYHTISRTYLQITNSSVPTECAACGKPIEPTEGAAGPCNADGELTLICNGHLRDSRQFINLLADFISVERQRSLEQHDFNTKLIRNSHPDAWFLY